jgi:hypothetical protein
MSHAAKREAYGWVARALQHVLEVSDRSIAGGLTVEALEQVWRIRDAMRAAAAVQDGPGVEGHVSGNGKAPVPYKKCMSCPALLPNGGDWCTDCLQRAGAHL